MTDTLAEVDYLLRDNAMMRPTPVRDRWGRYKRDPGGQWDWFYALDPPERAYISRRHMVERFGIGPDDIATWQDTDIDTAMARFVDAVRRSRTSDPMDDDYAASCDDDDVTELIGPDELATLLCVQRNTIVQWRKRGQLLEPFMTLSGMPIWRKADVRDWAKLAGKALATT